MSKAASGSACADAKPERWYDRIMSKAIQDVLPTALALTTVERAELAAELLASLDGEPEADVEAAWAAEIERRAQRVPFVVTRQSKVDAQNRFPP